ncbi:hypothetical protein [Halocatena pleomorpha]|uniref:Uncharacterized protein n=1 Tax=Halocatena pleomorpha TaxID=1785090 RepID=A0A3P3R8C8_9EURY|nr:hypothetical protein [Halocatena pleomorpha]RRJ29697.1 hypothetical protein EIK79_12070 [Halocatena pleomorpha]
MHREYILGVNIVTQRNKDRVRFRFEAPNHRGAVFRAAESAELYADVYFDVNGFEEEGTGERGVPPVIIQAGRDTLATYLLTQPHTDINWVASFYGKTPPAIEQYVAAVRTRAEEIREGAKERERSQQVISDG